MELSLNFEQLKLKSEYLNTNPRCIHYHENCGNPLFITWSGCVTVIYSLKNLTEVTLWDPIEPLVRLYYKKNLYKYLIQKYFFNNSF